MDHLLKKRGADTPCFDEYYYLCNQQWLMNPYSKTNL